MTDETTMIKRRIEACAIQANMNATASGGDAATAGMDLLCAFVLLTARGSGHVSDDQLSLMMKCAKIAVSDFWPDERLN